MDRAIELANISTGGPFGAVIMNNEGIVIGEGHNEVVVNNDPTAHAEMVAIRSACATIKNFNLEGCTIYTSCEPCPMCLSAIYWSRIPVVYYANTRQDAASIDFDDQKIYDEISKKIEDREVKMIHIENTNAYNTFQNWKNNLNKKHY